LRQAFLKHRDRPIAMTKACAAVIDPTSDRNGSAKLSPTSNRTFAAAASGLTGVSVNAMTGTPRLWQSAATSTTSGA